MYDIQHVDSDDHLGEFFTGKMSVEFLGGNPWEMSVLIHPGPLAGLRGNVQ